MKDKLSDIIANTIFNLIVLFFCLVFVLNIYPVEKITNVIKRA